MSSYDLEINENIDEYFVEGIVKNNYPYALHLTNGVT